MEHKPRIDPGKLRFCPGAKDMIQELRKFKYPKPVTQAPIVYDHEFDYHNKLMKRIFPMYGGIKGKKGA